MWLSSRRDSGTTMLTGFRRRDVLRFVPAVPPRSTGARSPGLLRTPGLLLEGDVFCDPSTSSPCDCDCDMIGVTKRSKRSPAGQRRGCGRKVVSSVQKFWVCPNEEEPRPTAESNGFGSFEELMWTAEDGEGDCEIFASSLSRLWPPQKYK